MIEQTLSDEYYMRKALNEAETAFSKNEVPVGAIIVCKNKIIARAHNLTEKLTDFTAHAEMQVFTAASEFLQNKYLNECTIYVTLEPCLMCAGASDQRRGFKSLSANALHPSTVINGGVLEAECSSLLTSFFSAKRK